MESDIIEEEKRGNYVQIFCLIGDGKDYLVDLRDGHFEINEAPLFLHDDLGLTNFRLIYYRTRRQHFSMDLRPKGEETLYHLGWQTNDKNGNNIQKIITIT